jgi:hypothetical protein
MPESVTLRNGEPTLVRLKDPSETTGLSLLLRPRKLSVNVTVGPKALCWPGAPARVSVRASDADTGAAIPDLELRPVVTLGVEAVPLDFASEAGALHAVVPAPDGAGPGPWVLRVQVNDAFGSAIGRDFVEIDRCAPKAAPRPKTAATSNRGRG